MCHNTSALLQENVKILNFTITSKECQHNTFTKRNKKNKKKVSKYILIYVQATTAAKPFPLTTQQLLHKTIVPH